MNGSDNCYLELFKPSPVRGYNWSFFFTGENKKKRKRDHSSSVDDQTRKIVLKLNFSAEKVYYSAA